MALARTNPRWQAASFTCATLEPLEPRTLLSLAYYDSLPIADMPGFPGGPAGSLAGASENGEYLWSLGAQDGATGDSPAFLVIDGEYRPWSEFPDLADSLVVGINSRGTVLARDQLDDRLFVLDLGAGARSYLEDQITDAPPEFYLGGVSPLTLGDDGIVVLADNTDDYDRGGAVWALLDGQVRELWHSEYPTREVFVEPGNTVYGQRYTIYDQYDPRNSRFDAVRWTPADGAAVLAEQRSLYGANANGDVLVTGPDGTEILLAGGGTRAVDSLYGELLDLDDDGIVVSLVDWGIYGNDYHASVFDGQATVILDQRGGIHDRPVTITDSGMIVLWSGISRRVGPGDMVRAAGDEAIVLVDGFGRTIVSFTSDWGGQGSISLMAGQIDYGNPGAGPSGPTDQDFVGLVVPRSRLAYRWVIANGFARREVYESAHDRFESDGGGSGVLLGGVRPAPFASPQGNGVIAMLREDGHMWLSYESRYFWGGQDHWLWISNDMTQNHLSKRGLETPAFTGSLDAFTTSWGAMNVVGLDADGQLHAVWWSPGLRSPMWTTTNLSELAGAPKLVGNVSAAATPWGGMQIHGTDEQGHLISVWWSPATGEWRSTDLTAQLGGPTLEAGTLDLDIGRWGSINLVAKDEGGQIVSYWWSRAAGWEATNVIEEGDQPRFVGRPSYFVGAYGGQHITGVDAAGHVLDLYWRPDNTGWHWRDLTAMAEA